MFFCLSFFGNKSAVSIFFFIILLLGRFFFICHSIHQSLSLFYLIFLFLMHLYHHQKHLKTDKMFIHQAKLHEIIILLRFFSLYFFRVFIFAAFTLLPYDNFCSFILLPLHLPDKILLSLSVPMSRQY